MAVGHLQALTKVILSRKVVGWRTIRGNKAYIFTNDIRKESLFIHDQPVGYEGLGEDTSTDVYLIYGKGLWTENRYISVGASLNCPLTK